MEIINETPWWVYCLFVILLVVGLKSTRPRTVSLNKMLILPSVFMLLNISWLAERLEGRYLLLVYWLFGLLIGFLIGWQTVCNWKIKADHRRQSISLPGSWAPLILILLVFAGRYFFVYNYEAHPDHSRGFFLADSLISGIFTGIFIGRAFDLYKKYKNG